jgi:SAM-dependent methyltransferase
VDRAPFPPLELATRVGALRPVPDPWPWYEEIGAKSRRDILAALGSQWSFDGKTVLDFGCGAGRTLRHFLGEADVAEFWGCDIDQRSIAWLEANLSPPLHIFVNADEPPTTASPGKFDLIYAVSVFTHLTGSWSRWLLELHRLLAPGGLLLATFMGRSISEAVIGESWVEGGYGMNVFRDGEDWTLGGPMVFHDPWWIRAHWGRAFEIVSLTDHGFAADGPVSQGAVLMRRRDVSLTPAELEALEPGEPREASALAHGVKQLLAETRALRRARDHLQAQLADAQSRSPELQADAAVLGEPTAGAEADAAVLGEPTADAEADAAVLGEPTADAEADAAVRGEPTADAEADAAVRGEPTADAEARSTQAARRRIRRLIELGTTRAVAAAEHALASRAAARGDDRPAAGAGSVAAALSEATATPAAGLGDRALGPRELAVEAHHATEILYDRLDPAKVAEIERRIREWPELAGYLDGGPDLPSRRNLLLSFGIWLAVPGLIEETGLSAAQPPHEVHAMARGPLSAAGGLYEADMLTSALASAGVEIATGVRDGLDFGCSSGRVVRVLAAAYPEIAWHACDPNADAIAWATRSLPAIDFFRSGDDPPLPLADASLDLAFAISIWSHFEPELGLRWFEEMHRLIRPGGHLVATTHGPASVEHYAANGLRTASQSAEIAASLYARGSWYAPEFGEHGDWGVVNPAWGTAFVSPEWILAKLLPRWQVLEFAPGRNQSNQDVYVLRRV